MKQSQPISRFIRASLLGGSANLIETTRSLFSVGYSLDRAGATESAKEVYRGVIEALDEVRGEAMCPTANVVIADCAIRHGSALCRMERFQEALAAFRYAAEVLDQLLVSNTTSVVIEKLAYSLRLLGLCALRCNDKEQAQHSLRRAAALYRGLIVFCGSAARHRLLNQFLRQTVSELGRVINKEPVGASEPD